MQPTYTKDGYLFFKVLEERPQSIVGDQLIINPEKIKNSLSYAKNHGLKNIAINPAYYKVDSIEFLSDFEFIEGLSILQDNLDLSPLESLVNLRSLGLSDRNPNINLKNLSKLEVLGISYGKRVSNLSNCTKLFWLWLDNFRENDLTSLSNLSELKYLNLHKTSIKTLAGIGNLTKLKRLFIDSASKLETLNGISEKNICLKTIDIYGAKNLRDYTAIANAQGIEKVWLRKTGDLPDISFLRKLKNIKDVAIGSKVVDGDISFLRGVEIVHFADFSHYNLKMKDLKK